MRPMEGISLSLFSDSEHGCRTVEVLAQTSTPVRRLIILIVGASAPNELFPQLAHTYLTSKQYTSSLLCSNTISYVISFPPFYTIPLDTSAPGGEDRPRCWRPHRCLKRSSAYGFSRSWLATCRVKLDDDATFAQRRACAYPALITIILPKDRVWFAGSAGRWVHS